MSNDTATVYTKVQAKEHDAKLAEATTILGDAHERAEKAANEIHRAVGDKPRYRARRAEPTWSMTFADAAEAAQSVAAGHVELLGQMSEWNLERALQRAADALQAHRTALQAVAAAREVVEQLDEVWRTHGRWNRFFMVGGHIHSSTACHSLHITTRIGWLPQLSGESEAEAVAAYGTVLCTKCFPSAPVEWTTKAPKPVDPELCPGSNKYVPGADLRLYSPRGTCPECGQIVSVTKIANARKHKRP
jgi:hypothetical protein